MLKALKNAVKQSVERACCDHDYSIKSLSGSTVSFKCVKCGKEVYLHQSRAPLELLMWGYGWYHGEKPDGETMDLLLHQRIAKNNEVMVPMRKVYVVSLLEKLDVVPYKDGHGSHVDLGDIRVVGIGFEEQKVEDILRSATTDELMKLYPYAAAECYAEGVRNRKEKIRFFHKGDTDRFYKEFEPDLSVRTEVTCIMQGR